MATLNGFDTETGERVFVMGGENAGFYEDLYATKAWKRFESEFGFEQNKTRLVEIMSQLHGHAEYLVVSQFVDAINAGMDAGEFNRKVVEQAAPVETLVQDEPVDRNGRPLTESQKRWAEYTRFANERSSKECHERARTDAGFASFVRKNREREMAQPIGDAVVDLNAPVAQSAKASDEIKAFADAYRRMPTAEVRRLSRADSNPVGFAEFNKQVDAAINAGLI